MIPVHWFPGRYGATSNVIQAIKAFVITSNTEAASV